MIPSLDNKKKWCHLKIIINNTSIIKMCSFFEYPLIVPHELIARCLTVQLAVDRVVATPIPYDIWKIIFEMVHESDHVVNCKCYEIYRKRALRFGGSRRTGVIPVVAIDCELEALGNFVPLTDDKEQQLISPPKDDRLLVRPQHQTKPARWWLEQSLEQLIAEDESIGSLPDLSSADERREYLKLLDDDLFAYLMKVPEMAKQKLDDELDEYWRRNQSSCDEIDSETGDDDW